ncbi:hypothetical protein FRACYDRAFT_247932 [Fragilariopsis cylindrus CCMP1102]|uniref:Ribosomal RNA methyltransferase FtsJ domain-containing protein n=1 Tax=Fragilariopsis cylindrus CCMP1102 TaxID=635003 RepID=A0A1E7EUZ0_9STRA|nr:hypothetical protein FRACYDRAFT_247932 [Fragilariopsis cylindrus CCMP1102]|eukprot:OEU09676.1 hypothetical protein FRACYDRAFT_247932 [Fragilariopsis cylindrus CCMP1102]
MVASMSRNNRTLFAQLLLIGLYSLWFAVIISTTTGFTPTNVLLSRHQHGLSSSSPSLLMSSRGGADNRGSGGYDKHNPGANRRKKPQDFDNDYSFDDNRIDNRNSNRNDNRNDNENNSNDNDNNDYKGRNRYSTSGEKKNYNDDDNNYGRGGGGGRGRRSGGRSTGGRGRGGRGGGRTGGRTGGRGRDQNQQRRRSSEYYEMERPPVPPFTSRPTYYTCRHTYESTLQEELERSCKGVSFSTPHPGLLQLLPASSDAMILPQQQQQPTYALQTLPNCVIVSAESIKGLANEVMKSLLLDKKIDNRKSNEKNANIITIIEELRMASQGSLAIHTLVPEMFRGTPESKLKQYNRIQKVVMMMMAMMTTVLPGTTDEKWLLQLLLLEPQIIAASFTKCTTTTTSTTITTSWPNWYLPGGLALVDIDNSNGNNEDDDYGEEQQQQQQRQQQKSSHRINNSYNKNNQINIPSSAYRKLLEAFWYMGDRPPSYHNYNYPVIDLGASPGGWTSVLRLMECNVIAVDRSPLEKSLMMDEERIEFIQGDAFKYIPPWVENNNKNGRITKLETPIPDTWMVSDIIAYPNKIIELIDTWTSNNFVSHLIVTMKFQSNDIPWNDIDSAKQIAIKNNYLVDTVHFFNNKNEITFMAMKQQNNNSSIDKKNYNIREDSVNANDSSDDNDNDDSSSSSSLLIGKPMYAPILPKQKQQSKNKKKSTATS